ncbi:MAG: 2-amino-4-hydroxy-6-hydroxymethyldihydropteridine diphosphokinase [Chloroflexi bacterium]|nr:2-amino-4-hydroxy-6-hydroxymethyldihydropteridine diphosphokinase [Chloroflexota bacterium]
MGSQIDPETVYIGLGSNLGDRIANLRSAINAIKQFGDSIELSAVYETEPFGVDEEQPKYLNMVVVIRTNLLPTVILSKFLGIERTHGRTRNRQNESRTLDIDILMVGSQVLETPELALPHPRMHERAFVMLPLSEIAPQAVHPTLKLTVSEIANQFGHQGVYRVGEIDELAGWRS